MSSLPTIRFHNHDFAEPLPDEGEHEAIVHSARSMTSTRGNSTLLVTYHLPDVGSDRDRVTNTSAAALCALSHRSTKANRPAPHIFGAQISL